MNLTGLNDVQREAVTCVDGPSLIIAGAGSGKTRVITYKIAHLIDSGVPPSSIMALTFTNKAAKEMKERISTLVGRKNAWPLRMGTFHSVFARILREYAAEIGFPRTFTIYDTSDSKNAIKRCLKELELDEKVYKPGDVLSRISNAKNYLVDAQAYLNNAEAIRKDMIMKKGRICDIYALYSKKCIQEGIMDFDDILLYMNKLLKNRPEVAEQLREGIRYLLVDEYQDTNLAQYYIVRSLASASRNITVVGDDSQSIYAFRGARIQNILNFRKDYPEAKEFRLEQNYRSTKTIVDAANSVIAHNSNRLKKECFSEGDDGSRIDVLGTYSDLDEAATVVSHILRTIRSTQASYDSFAILYRTNNQSRAMEEALRRRNIPYRIYAGHSFYDRKEVKEVLAYLRLVLNHGDNDAFRRIVNIPARGIGATTVDRIAQAAAAENRSLFDTVRGSDLAQYGIKGTTALKLKAFAALIEDFSQKAASLDAAELVTGLMAASGLNAHYDADLSPEGMTRKENVSELMNGIREFVEIEMETAAENETEPRFPSLELYMENVALLTDADEKEDEEEMNKVKLMTVHSSKGLEFPYVYIIGMEENLFPSMMSGGSLDKLEEERRLFYVGLTRAEKAVTLSFAQTRFINGKTTSSSPSRFLMEIDRKFLNAPAGLFDRDEASLHTPEIEPAVRHEAVPRRLVRIPSAGRTAFSSRRDSPVMASASGGSSEFCAGDMVRHLRFGRGTVKSVDGSGPDARIVVEFDNFGTKTLLAKFAKLEKM